MKKAIAIMSTIFISYTMNNDAKARGPAVCFDNARVTLVKVHDNYDVHFSTTGSTNGRDFKYGTINSGINYDGTKGMHKMLSLALATGIKVRGEADYSSDCEKQTIKSLTLLSD
ncbi:hypothetical protein HEQ62_07530 [Haematospirillum jordaniae]|uniref:Uncharacterized protein n=1 Tax=Haematospirillum jordaniae TaxID=1549855 RepID=A0A143DBW2_9PROT|nr:hypothetical protein [Haematospirillum jordaniae]AMW34079.1 hypothetical protein AY555_01610 [Haematospirillum jordaniae]NKD45281.1 hypothetical protein [Haematospirillum jordaniae]NKD57273.1 hypothetical protein [Haematospirillum jordaniae]NKD59627.1 hypothetical protein [Haematospirillum jordaniae]NKD67199.1 hypothetical protein [Haematospirillum jordaniae]